jgi:hypothetical protein
MDSLITVAARALVARDPLGALKRVALRDDAPALALRGIAMAQLGDLVRAKASDRAIVAGTIGDGYDRRAPANHPRRVLPRGACASSQSFSRAGLWLSRPGPWLARV